MSVAWLEVPTPSGDLGEMGLASDVLDRLARQVRRSSDDLARTGASVEHAWEGEAALAFQRQQDAATRAVDAIALAQQEVAARVREYADEWETASRVAARARDDLEAAVQRYTAAARGALEDVARVLGEALDNPVADLLGHVVPAVRLLQQQVLGWHPPAAAPVLATTAVGLVDDLTEDRVVDLLHGAAGWAATRVLDGVEALVGLVGGHLAAAVDAVRSIERGLVAAVTAAQRLARAALRALYDVGVRTTEAIGRVVRDVSSLVWQVTLDAAEAGLLLLADLGLGVLVAAYWAYEVAAGLLGVALVLRRVARGEALWSSGRRRAPSSYDDDAFVRWRTDPAWRRQVVELSDLADDSYRDTGAPVGWTRLDTITGPEGFAAAVYRDPTGDVVVAFRGSEAGDDLDVRDWSQDALNASDLPTAQGAWAIRTALQVRARHPDVTFTGHSLGGSLASVASITTGDPAVTFNAAGVGSGNHGAALVAGRGAGASEQQITNFHTTNDILTLGQQHLPVYVAAGAQVTIASTTDDPGEAHGLDAFEEFRRIREDAR